MNLHSDGKITWSVTKDGDTLELLSIPYSFLQKQKQPRAYVFALRDQTHENSSVRTDVDRTQMIQAFHIQMSRVHEKSVERYHLKSFSFSLPIFT